MADYNIGSVAEAAHDYIDEIDANVSGNLVLFASGAVLHLSNFVNETIEAPIPEKYEQIAVGMTAILALSRQANVGVDFNYSIGEIRVDKGANNTAETTQIEAIKSMIEPSIKLVGRRQTHFKVFG